MSSVGNLHFFMERFSFCSPPAFLIYDAAAFNNGANYEQPKDVR